MIHSYSSSSPPSSSSSSFAYTIGDAQCEQQALRGGDIAVHAAGVLDDGVDDVERGKTTVRFRVRYLKRKVRREEREIERES